MPEINNNSLSPDEIINFIEQAFSEEQQKQIIKILLRAEHTIEPSALLNELINKGIFCISDKPFIKYRLEKYFTKYGIDKISERKNTIFSLLPDLKGLQRGKSASYDDLIDFLEENHVAIIKKFTSEIVVYDFSPAFKKNGYLCTLYFNRKYNPQANYKFDSRSGHYILKEDDATALLRSHGISFEVENPDSLFPGSSVSLNETVNKIEKTTKPNFLKIFLLVIFWPIGLYVLYKKYWRTD